MALNPSLSQESSSANELLYLVLSSKTLLILKKFYESVEYVQEIRPIGFGWCAVGLQLGLMKSNAKQGKVR